MKPLSTKQQIAVLKEMLSLKWNIYGMCGYIEFITLYKYRKYNDGASNFIPSFTHDNYVKFYPNVGAVQRRKEWPWWDKDSFFGNLRRRWFIRHLIKELKKQL
jgi:hypothetical protein